jgi:hypothetical protein
MSLDEYSTPAPHRLYSADFFNNLDFRQATSMVFPVIAPPDTLDWVFHDVVPSDVASQEVLPRDVIPCYYDLFPIIQEMPDAFAKGQRSVVVAMTRNGSTTSQICHFSKVLPIQTTVVVLKSNSLSLASRSAYSSSSTTMRMPLVLQATSWIISLAFTFFHQPMSITSSTSVYRRQFPDFIALISHCTSLGVY